MMEQSVPFESYHLQTLENLIHTVNTKLQRYGMMQSEIDSHIQILQFNKQHRSWAIRTVYSLLAVLHCLDGRSSENIDKSKSIQKIQYEKESIISSLKGQLQQTRIEKDRLFNKIRDNQQAHQKQLQKELKLQKDKSTQDTIEKVEKLKHAWARALNQCEKQKELLKLQLINKQKQKKPTAVSFTTKTASFTQNQQALHKTTMELQKQLARNIEQGLDTLRQQNQVYKKAFLNMFVQLSKIETQLFNMNYLSEPSLVEECKVSYVMNDLMCKEVCDELQYRLKRIVNVLQHQNLEVKQRHQPNLGITVARLAQIRQGCTNALQQLINNMSRVRQTNQSILNKKIYQGANISVGSELMDQNARKLCGLEARQRQIAQLRRQLQEFE